MQLLALRTSAQVCICYLHTCTHTHTCLLTHDRPTHTHTHKTPYLLTDITQSAQADQQREPPGGDAAPAGAAALGANTAQIAHAAGKGRRRARVSNRRGASAYGGALALRTAMRWTAGWAPAFLVACALVGLAAAAPRAPRDAPAAPGGADFWANKLAGRSGLRAEAPATSVDADAPTPEAVLTEALSTGPTNRRPVEERAELEHAAIKEVLQDMSRLGDSRAHRDRQLPRKRPWRGSGDWSTGGAMAPAAPRTWDAHLQSFNEKHGRDAEERKKADFVARLGKLVSHLNATIVNAPKKQVASVPHVCRGSMAKGGGGDGGGAVGRAEAGWA